MPFHRTPWPLVARLMLTSLVPAAVLAQAPVRTANGTVRGLALPSGVSRYAGIPFAAPPIGALRWKPPQPAANWPGVRAATGFAHQCMQARVFDDMVFRNSGTSEDCLYLNVWTSAPTAVTRMPVLVYVYGGGFVGGDGSELRYDGEQMARKGIVVVTVNYRLGIFGFFSHPELARESARKATGNYGLMDQVAALRWVKANIAAFGGDPARVTIAGESAGSFSVSALMASPQAQGLIAGAIGESGAFFSSSLAVRSADSTQRDGTTFGTAVGASTLPLLRALSAHELLAASERRDLPQFGPSIDGDFLPESPKVIFAAGRQARVPLLAGWNSEEQRGRSLVRDLTPEQYTAALQRGFGARAEEARTLYGSGATPAAIAQAATDIRTDEWMGYATWSWLEAQSRTAAPVYRYFYARPRPALTKPAPARASATPDAWDAIPSGASHSAEIEYAMGNLPLNTVFAWTPEDYTVSATMMNYFANFVKTGDPNGAGLPAWPVGRADANGTVMRMRIDVQSAAEPEPRARYLFLQSLAR